MNAQKKHTTLFHYFLLYIKYCIYCVQIVCYICILCVIIINILINILTASSLYTTIDDTPSAYYALLLGTSKYSSPNHINAFYQNRINAAVEAYNNNKFQKIIVSGDQTNNEPQRMKQDLIKAGIAPEIIIEDRNGYSTIESIINTSNFLLSQKKSIQSLVIISQRFHNQRAVFLAQALHHDIPTWAYNAQSVTTKNIPVLFREFFARVKAMIDIISIYIHKPNQIFQPEQLLLS